MKQQRWRGEQQEVSMNQLEWARADSTAEGLGDRLGAPFHLTAFPKTVIPLKTCPFPSK